MKANLGVKSIRHRWKGSVMSESWSEEDYEMLENWKKPIGFEITRGFDPRVIDGEQPKLEEGAQKLLQGKEVKPV